MKTIKTTENLVISKVGATGNDNVYLNVDSNGVLEISTTTGSTGGIKVLGATSTSTFQGNTVFSGSVSIAALGANIDVNGYDIVSSSNGDIEIDPDGTGKILLTGVIKLGGNIDVNGNDITTTVTNGDVELIPNGTGSILLTGPTLMGGNLNVASYNIVSTSNNDIELDPDGTGKILLTAETKLGGNLDVNGNDITTTVTNGDVEVIPNGTGQILLTGVVKVGGDIDVNGNDITTSVTNGDVTLVPNGTGKIYINGISELGGNLNVGSYNIISSSNNDIEIDPDGTGKILLTAETKLAGNLDVNGNQITTTVTNGGVSIQPNGTGNITLDAVTWPNTAGTNTYLLKTDGVSATSWGQATYLELSDTPNSYATYGDRLLKVNTGATATDYSAYTESDIENVIGNSFGAATVSITDADYTLTLDEAKSGKLLIMGTKSGDTFYAKSVSIQNAGTGYTAGDTLTLVGGTNTVVAKIKVDTVGGGGDITGILIETDVDGDEGNYTVVPANPVSVTGGTGTSATFNLTWDYRGVVVNVSAAHEPVTFDAYQLYNGGDIILKSTDQVYREGMPLSILQLRSFMINFDLLGDNDLREFTPESPCINDRKVVDLITDANYDINFHTSKNYHLTFTDSGTVLTAARDVNVSIGPFDPSQPGIQIIKNDTLQNITFKSGGTGVTVLPSTSRVVYFDGTDHVKLPTYVIDDTSPTLGGNLNVGSFDIVSSSNGDIDILPNGSGRITLDATQWPAADGTSDQVLKTNGSGSASWTTLNLNYLDDVVITSADEGDVLFHNGTNWVNSSYAKFYEGTQATTDATATVVKAIPIASGKVATFNVKGHAYEIATGDVYSVHLFGCVKNHGGTTAIVGSVDNTHVHNPGGNSWTITAVANDTNDTLDITVTGEAAKNLSWKFKVDLVYG
jgi:uncharacterized protein YjlB